MTSIINPTEPLSALLLPSGGFDISGLENISNRLNGSEQRDSITGGTLADVLSGLAGQDTIDGLAGDDIILGGESDDLLRGGDGNDSLEGDAGNDLLVGGLGSNTLRGGTGDDTLIASNPAAILDGGLGRDQLVAAGGGNILIGGAQRDQFELDLTQQPITTLNQIIDYQQGEKILVKGNAPTGEFTYDLATGILSLNGQGIAQLTPGVELNLNDLEYVAVNIVNGTEQADALVGSDLADVLNGLAGSDLIIGAEGDDTLNGGVDNDVLRGDTGNDLLIGGPVGNNTLEGGEGNDTLQAGVNPDLEGNDAFLARIESIIVNDGKDSLSGDGGDDVLIVANGDNTLSGGLGADTFQFNFASKIPDNLNQISDFQPEEDTIVIEGVSDTASVNYDPTTGIVSLDGKGIIQTDLGLDINENNIELL